MSKSVYARVVHDLEFEICSVVRSNDSFNFPLGLIKYIVIVIIYVHRHINCTHKNTVKY